MKREFMRVALKTALGALSYAVLLEGILVNPAHAQVNVNVNIGAPPPVVVHTAPTMLFLPEPAVYVAVGIPYEIFFVGGRYYYLRGDNWFWASGYDGPWVHVVHRSLPPGLRKYRTRQLIDFREREYRVYRVEGRNFKGRHFQGESHNSHGNGKGRDKGRGRN